MSHFRGTAAFYARFRPGYPPELWDRLVAEAGADRSGRVLDLGSGPGTASFELASRVGSVVAVDFDAGMVAEGRRLAEAVGIDTIEWVNAPAEAVDYPDGSFQLIVIASAFTGWIERLGGVDGPDAPARRVGCVGLVPVERKCEFVGALPEVVVAAGEETLLECGVVDHEADDEVESIPYLMLVGDSAADVMNGPRAKPRHPRPDSHGGVVRLDRNFLIEVR